MDPADELENCIGEFPLFPGWLFFEKQLGEEYFLSAYGSGGRQIKKQSFNREYAIAECIREILKQ